MKRAITAALLLATFVMLTAPRLRAEATAPTLEQALEFYRSGTPEQAVPMLKAALASQPDDPGNWQAHLALARIYHRQNRPADVLAQLGAISPQQRNTEARLLEGLALLDTGQIEAGVGVLRALPEQDLNGNQRQQRLAALVHSFAEAGRPIEALFFLQQRLLSGHDRTATTALLQEAHQLLTEYCSDSTLAEAAFMFRGTPLGQDAMLQQARRHKENGQSAQARQLLQTILNSAVSFPFRDDAQLLLQQISHSAPSAAIGVILPLSGRYSQFGNLVRRGMELALELHNRKHAPVSFLIRDSAGNPDLAAKYVTEFAASPQVMAILGPLAGSTASRAAAEAEQAQLPLLTLSQRAGLADIGPWIFRNFLTTELQARTLADYAVTRQQLRSFGILAPETRLGRELAQAFSHAVQARGGQVVAVQTYAPQATDFRDQIMRLQGLDPAAVEPPKDAAGEEQEQLPEPPPFDALFLPDTPDRLALVAPQLPFYGLSDMPLLGSAGWAAPNLLPLAGKYLENAVFVSGFFRYSPYPFVREFSDLYFARHAAEPTLLEAQGYDAAGMILSLLATMPAPSRAELRGALSRIQNYPGVTGATRFTPSGEADRELYLLQIRDGSLVQLN